MKKEINILKVFRMTLTDLFFGAPIFLIGMFLANALGSFMLVMITYVEQMLYDKVTLLFFKQLIIKDIILWIFILCLAYIIQQISVLFASIFTDILSGKAYGKLYGKMSLKISKLPPIEFEKTDRLNDIEKAMNGLGNSLNFAMLFLSMLAFDIPYFVFMEIYLVNLHPLLGMALIFIFIPALITNFIRMKTYKNAEDKAAPWRRKKDYYSLCIESPEYFKETRMLGAYGFFKDKYMDCVNKLMEISCKTAIKTGLIELVINIIIVVGYVGVLCLLIVCVLKGQISLGAFAAVFTSIYKIYDILNSMLTSKIGSMSDAYGTIQNYYKFMMEEEENRQDEDWGNNFDVVLENVSFRYPGCKDYAIKNISTIIKSGQSLAVVGANGSGKSTLIKLISGLYEPCSGRIYFRNSEFPEKTYDLKQMSYKSLFSKTSVVLQQYAKYMMSLKDNVSISDVYKKWDQMYVKNLFDEVGIELSKRVFPEMMKTMLSREFGGIDLSGGQWQRIAIIRGIYRKHQLIILDEPTSAIDPIEETLLYNQFAKMSKNKTAVLVTHRLGSVRMADRIIVIENGTLIQDGTHSDLINQNGKYKEMYESQKQWYE